MGLKQRLAAQLGHAPSKDELRAAKLAAQAASARKEDSCVRVDMQLIAKGTKQDERGKFFTVASGLSKRPVLVKLDKNMPSTKLSEIKTKATNGFASDAAGWKVYIGNTASVDDSRTNEVTGLVFVGNEDDWQEQFFCARTDPTELDIVLFLRQMCNETAASQAGDYVAPAVNADIKVTISLASHLAKPHASPRLASCLRQRLTPMAGDKHTSRAAPSRQGDRQQEAELIPVQVQDHAPASAVRRQERQAQGPAPAFAARRRRQQQRG